MNGDGLWRRQDGVVRGRMRIADQRDIVTQVDRPTASRIDTHLRLRCEVLRPPNRESHTSVVCVPILDCVCRQCY